MTEITSAIRQPGAILLVSCYELGHQPLGIASPLAFLQQAGYSPAALDVAVEGLNAERLLRAKFIGISVPMHTALRLGIWAAQLVREANPTCHICFYGLYASLNAKYLLEQVADSVIGGEFEASLVNLLKALEAGQSLSIESVSTRGHFAQPVLRRLSFPVPVRNGLLPPLQKYAQLEIGHERRLVGYVEASRGCLHHCLHCPIPPVYGGRFFVVPADVVLEDVRQLVASGARHITFGDPDFLNGPGHSLKIVRAMRREFPQLTFDFTAKIEHLLKYRRLLPELRESGCLFIVSAVESLSETVLKNLDKGHTRADVYELLRIVRQAGITLRPTWVAFTPWTTRDDYLEMLDFIEAERFVYNVDPVQYSLRLLIPPGSALLSSPAIQLYLGSRDEANFIHRWRHPDSAMDDLQQSLSAVVERAAATGEDAAVTFERVKKLAYGRAGDEVAPVSLAMKERPPRLTESWFC
jgi:radical SAM superfamily enzyme YgiQ (UPF0313 family)